MITKKENLWANKEIERWEMKKLGVNPLNHYISTVASTILKNIPKDIVRHSGVDYHIIQDIITQEPDGSLDKNIYDLYEEYVEIDRAAEILGKVLEEYMLGG
jgi:hypothetical protein